ncbi:hypothetical protein ANANG_G00006490 [Anguilla anguilla]|uniref:Uncharacterized protein n=1 Tax=Anguilla anguilla TaxID=7936 RepID=A0A9D3MVZ2_ANGAN|nr:hypothetical protein ANANG_G00006490 [Anguilla anguilla]
MSPQAWPPLLLVPTSWRAGLPVMDTTGARPTSCLHSSSSSSSSSAYSSRIRYNNYSSCSRYSITSNTNYFSISSSNNSPWSTGCTAATHSLQATPNSTVHSLPAHTHPPLVDLWGAGQTEAYQAEAGGYVAVSSAEGALTAAGGEEAGAENAPLLEQQEEEEEEEEQVKEEEVTLCLEPEPVTLASPAPKEEATSAGSSSPSHAPGEPAAELKASDVTSSASQSLDGKGEDTEDVPVAVAAAN